MKKQNFTKVDSWYFWKSEHLKKNNFGKMELLKHKQILLDQTYFWNVLIVFEWFWIGVECCGILVFWKIIALESLRFRRNHTSPKYGCLPLHRPGWSFSLSEWPTYLLQVTNICYVWDVRYASMVHLCKSWVADGRDWACACGGVCLLLTALIPTPSCMARSWQILSRI